MKARTRTSSGGRQSGGKIPPEALELVAARFRALGEPLRLRILQSLEPGEMSVSGLTASVDSSQPNVSKHLRVLQDVGLVRRRLQGSIANYSIADETVLEICELVCTGVRQRLESQVGALSGSPFERSPRRNSFSG